ncbi:huntingtin-interacting protein M [Dasypus novemcinctus]|uniref:huntingtin-interacting protein M n=1 Tax=Dasypus novemcinctus TaxID=9361 RepID=UPI000328F3E8|nr:huntingtin-interacting protein M-like [Dasypus novemcinctus]
MSGKRSHESSHNRRTLTPSLSARTEMEFSPSGLERLLQEDRYAQYLRSNTPDFLLAFLDYLTTYILELAANEAHNNHRSHIAPLDVERGVRNNRLLRHLLRGVNFSQSDEMFHSRKNG